MGSPVYSLPAGDTNIEVLKDPAKLPLSVAIDIVIGETSAYADYIIPDHTFISTSLRCGRSTSFAWL